MKSILKLSLAALAAIFISPELEAPQRPTPKITIFASEGYTGVFDLQDIWNWVWLIDTDGLVYVQGKHIQVHSFYENYYFRYLTNGNVTISRNCSLPNKNFCDYVLYNIMDYGSVGSKGDYDKTYQGAPGSIWNISYTLRFTKEHGGKAMLWGNGWLTVPPNAGYEVYVNGIYWGSSYYGWY